MPKARCSVPVRWFRAFSSVGASGSTKRLVSGAAELESWNHVPSKDYGADQGNCSTEIPLGADKSTLYGEVCQFVPASFWELMIPFRCEKRM